jgi:hypothetical protein
MERIQLFALEEGANSLIDHGRPALTECNDLITTVIWIEGCLVETMRVSG